MDAARSVLQAEEALGEVAEVESKPSLLQLALLRQFHNDLLLERDWMRPQTLHLCLVHQASVAPAERPWTLLLRQLQQQPSGPEMIPSFLPFQKKNAVILSLRINDLVVWG
jgi:hypothetical protein